MPTENRNDGWSDSVGISFLILIIIDWLIHYITFSTSEIM